MAKPKIITIISYEDCTIVSFKPEYTQYEFPSLDEALENLPSLPECQDS